jgi:hypothetical protein
MRRQLAAAGAALMLAITAAPAVHAQYVGEIVVSAEHREATPPHVVVFRRADNLVIEVSVDCDTRDPGQRMAEVKATLHNMVDAAAASQVELGVESSDVVLALKPDAVDELLKPGEQPDSTTATLVVKTHITDADTFETASGRIDAFLHKTRLVGRTLVAHSGDWQLTLVTPRQYHGQIVAAVAQEASDTLKSVGPGYGVELAGLEGAVQWVRSGPLDLALFVPYQMKVVPLAR